MVPGDPFGNVGLVTALFIDAAAVEEGREFEFAFGVKPVLPERLRLSMDKPSVGLDAGVAASVRMGGRLLLFGKTADCEPAPLLMPLGTVPGSRL